ncbi:hypothetical protein EVAR_56289_1 [Eumeta japonica]|uniref:Uncharacterized protein n=1 Tax=Eumeta variegata TaxID=151549 RepID=A0A4C1SR08_EUMVA|nr:hypothetical protein EVAR_56289_1 [Eumeta japonica]
MVNVPAFTTYCGLGAERIGPITAISRSCANPFASDPRSFVGAAISVILHIITTIQTSQNGIKPRCAISGFYDSTSTHQVITFLMSTFLLMKTCRVLLGLSVSHHQQALLDPESGSSYDDSEFSDDDDAEYLVTSAKRRFSRIYQTMRSYHLSVGTIPQMSRFDCLGTERHSEKYTRRCKRDEENCEKGTIIAPSGDVMVLAGCKNLIDD